MAKTGNLFFETAERTNPDNKGYVPSGIYRNDKTWLYVQGNYEIIYLLGKRQLQHVHEAGKNGRLPERSGFRETESNTKTSLGFLLKQEYVENYIAQLTIYCHNKEGLNKIKKKTNKIEQDELFEKNEI